MPNWGKTGLVIVIAVLLFFVSGAEAAIGFLHHDVSQEILGSASTVLAVVLTWLVRQGVAS